MDLQRLSKDDIDQLTGQLRTELAGAHSCQQVLERTVQLIWDAFRIPGSNEPACVLVRAFESCHYARLPAHYQYAAEELLEHTRSHPDMRCLALMGTRGLRPLWNEVTTSTRHQCIPLPSAEAVGRAPMMSRLFDQFGVSVDKLVAKMSLPTADLAEAPLPSAQTVNFNAFHIAQALGSPFVPAQEDFVKVYGVESVLGLGGLLDSGDIFAILLFTRVPITGEVASKFQQLAPLIRETLLTLPQNRTFTPSDEGSTAGGTQSRY